MLWTSDSYTLQTETIHTHQSKQYRITDAGSRKVASFEEDASTSKDWLNHVLKTFNLRSFSSLHIKLLSKRQEVIATIHRKKGFSDDAMITTGDTTYMLCFKGTMSQRITVKQNGTLQFVVKGKNMAADFLAQTSDQEIGGIKKRSIPVPSTKETLVAGDLYHVNGSCCKKEQLTLLLCIALLIDVTYHQR